MVSDKKAIYSDVSKDFVDGGKRFDSCFDMNMSSPQVPDINRYLQILQVMNLQLRYPKMLREVVKHVATGFG